MQGNESAQNEKERKEMSDRIQRKSFDWLVN